MLFSRGLFHTLMLNDDNWSIWNTNQIVEYKHILFRKVSTYNNLQTFGLVPYSLKSIGR